MKHTGQLIRTFSHALVFTGAMLLCVGLFFYFGSRVEGSIWPVIRHVQISGLSIDDKQTSFWVSAEQIRECEFLGVSALVKSGQQLEQASVGVRTPGGDLDTRPLGAQSYGFWVLVPGADEFVVVIRHQCHALWPQSTTILDRRL
jgi:hypothetical protein